MVEIPSDLHPKILKALPSKCLLKFLTVSKSWYSSIKSPTFIKSHRNYHQSHVNNNNNNNHREFLLKSKSSDYFVVRCHNPTGGPQRSVQLPRPPGNFKKIAASLDSLICLHGCTREECLLLWNPSINKYTRLELPPSTSTKKLVIYGVGLGSCNRVENDNDYYKVVLVTFNGLYYSAAGVQYTCLNAHVLYSINDPSLGWKSVSIPPIEDLYSFSGSCFVNDTIYWIVFRCYYYWYPTATGGVAASRIDVYGASILTYDVRNECFSKLQLPMVLKDVKNPNLSLSVIGESLAVVQLVGRKEYHYFGDESQQLSSVIVWRMEEEESSSWKVLYQIELSSSSSVLDWDLWADREEDGKVVFITTSSGKIIVFKKGSCGGGYVGEITKPEDKAYTYTQNLVLLDGLQRHQLAN